MISKYFRFFFFNELSHFKKRKILKLKKKGEIFGEDAFFTGGPRDFSCRSLQFTSLLMINRAQEIQIFKENEEDYEKFCMIKDKIILTKDYSLLKIRCYHCRSLKHIIKNCPLLHYIPDFEKIIKRHEFYNEEPRRLFSRRKVMRFSSRKIIEDAVNFTEKGTLNIPFSKITQKLTSFDMDENISIFDLENPSEKKEELDSIPEKDLSQENESPIILEKNENPFIFKEEEAKESFKECIQIYDTSSNELLPFMKQASSSSKSILPINKKGKSSDYPSFSYISNNPLSSNKIIKENGFSTCTLETKNKESYCFEKMKNSQQYYPEMNCKVVLLNINSKINFIKSFQLFSYRDYVKEITKKLKNFRKYSFFGAKIKELIINKFLKKRQMLRKVEEHSQSESIHKFNKNNSVYTNFFERNATPLDKTFKSLVSSLLKKPKITIANQQIKPRFPQKKKIKNRK